MVKNSPAVQRPGLDPWDGKIPWRRAWQPTPVFLSGESPWTEELGGLQSMGLQRVGYDWVTKNSTQHINLSPVILATGHVTMLFRSNHAKTSDSQGHLILWNDNLKIQQKFQLNKMFLSLIIIIIKDINKSYKLLEEINSYWLPTTCFLLRNLYAGQEATVRTRHGTMDGFQIGKRVRQGCILPPCLFNFYAEYIMWNAGLDELQAGIKIARKTINSLRNADDSTTVMAESKETLKSLFMRVREESDKVGLKLNIQKSKITASSPITSWQIDE